MNWKEFFIDKRKIILTIILLLIPISAFFIPDFQNTYLHPLTSSGIILGTLLFYGPAYLINSILLQKFLVIPLSFGAILWALTVIYWYILSCLVIWIHDVVKKKK